ncbi:MAG: HAD family hydrolase [Desulfopila sp.]
MLQIAIPGRAPLILRHLVLDYNGTLAEDGRLLSGIAERLLALQPVLDLHVVTADTHHNVAQQMAALPIQLHILTAAEQDRQKARQIQLLGSSGVVAIGNGRNDSLMLAESALGIAVIQREGCAGAALQAADIICTDCRDGLDLLLFPDRLKASLRN